MAKQSIEARWESVRFGLGPFMHEPWVNYCSADSERKCSSDYRAAEACRVESPDRRLLCTRELGHRDSHIACEPMFDNASYFSVEHNLLVWE